jgi:hypothetical protein
MSTSKQHPPANLRTRGKALFRAIVAGFRLDPAETALLHELCRTVDEVTPGPLRWRVSRSW